MASQCRLPSAKGCGTSRLRIRSADKCPACASPYTRLQPTASHCAPCRVRLWGGRNACHQTSCKFARLLAKVASQNRGASPVVIGLSLHGHHYSTWVVAHACALYELERLFEYPIDCMHSSGAPRHRPPPGSGNARSPLDPARWRNSSLPSAAFEPC